MRVTAVGSVKPDLSVTSPSSELLHYFLNIVAVTEQ
jgi:hypothetical protein